MDAPKSESKNTEKEIEEQAALHHLAQALAYYMGRRYHKRRGKKLYVGICNIGIGFHLWSAYKHLRDL